MSATVTPQYRYLTDNISINSFMTHLSVYKLTEWNSHKVIGVDQVNKGLLHQKRSRQSVVINLGQLDCLLNMFLHTVYMTLSQFLFPDMPSWLFNKGNIYTYRTQLF